MKAEQIKIEDFSPNCLMGVIGAVSNYKKYTKNINRLYFHKSYVYRKNDGPLYLSDKNCMNAEFSRELPMDKELFMRRMKDYYGLQYSYQEHSDFESYINEVERFTKSNEPIMAEIDFYFMRKYNNYKKVHSQHMMIIYGVDKEHKTFSICEAVYGHFKMEFNEYYEYFQDVIRNRKRNVFLLRVTKEKQIASPKINIQWFLSDIEKTLNNLTQNKNANLGMEGFRYFKEDFLNVLGESEHKNNLFISGMWVFMCDHMNNINFINEWKKDYPDLYPEALEVIRKASTIINRKWFYLTMALKDREKYREKDFEKALSSIEKADNDLINNLIILKDELLKR